MEDMMEVCRELEIKCETEESDLPEKDIFLIEKKIEAIKKRKAQQIEDSKKGKKIKLKRKVWVPKETKEGAEAVEETKKKAAPKKPERTAARPTAERRPATRRRRRPHERGASRWSHTRTDTRQRTASRLTRRKGCSFSA